MNGIVTAFVCNPARGKARCVTVHETLILIFLVVMLRFLFITIHVIMYVTTVIFVDPIMMMICTLIVCTLIVVTATVVSLIMTSLAMKIWRSCIGATIFAVAATTTTHAITTATNFLCPFIMVKR